MSASSTATAGTNATATQYNDLRTDAINERRVVLFEIKGSLVTGDDQVKIPVPYDATVTKIRAKLTSGSATIRFMKGATTVKSGISVGTSYADETSITNPSLTSNDDDLDLDITAVSSADTLRGMVFFTVVK